MVQFESLVLPCIVSITVALTWIIFLIDKASQRISRIFIIGSYALALASVLLFTGSLVYIIQNLTVEAPTKIWASLFILGWVSLFISFFVVYMRYILHEPSGETLRIKKGEHV